MGIKSRSGSGIRILDEHPGSYFRELGNIFWVLNILVIFFDADPGSGIFLIRDGKTSDPESRINIPDPQLRVLFRMSWKGADTVVCWTTILLSTISSWLTRAMCRLR
jgi:hypothetical protein